MATAAAMRIRPGASETKLAWLALTLILLTVAARSVFFGNPIVHVDEEFYLLAGDRMLQGALPYVDVWDRKPFGLFLLYAAIRELGGGNGVLQYQAVAAAFAAATASGIGVWAARSGKTIVGGLAAGILYIAMLHRFSGYGGEAEVFMNAFMLVGAAFTWRALGAERNTRVLFVNGLLAMLFVGLAIQIKTNAVFPGIFFGCALLHRAWRDGLRPTRLAAVGSGWIAMALAPTLLSILYYILNGHLNEYIFANFTSILLRQNDEEIGERIRSQLMNVVLIVGVALSLVACAWRAFEQEQRREVIFLAAWLGICFLAFVVIGGFWANYALIIGPPAAILIGQRLQMTKLGLAGLAFVLAFTLFVGRREVQHAQSAEVAVQSYRHMIATIQNNRDSTCLYVYRGYPSYYRDSGTCMPTRFIFPNHLSMMSEQNALGVDTGSEVARILATRPKLIMFAESRANVNRVTENMVRQDLALRYEPIAMDGSHTLYRLRPQLAGPDRIKSAPHLGSIDIKGQRVFPPAH